MLDHKRIQKIGNFVPVIVCASLGLACSARAADVQFSAQVDRKQISQGDTVSLNFTVKVDGAAMVREPSFSASDFTVVNEFSSTSVRSTYDANTGKISMVNTQQITKVLRPLKAGKLTISHLQMNVGGQTLQAPDISIEVVAGAGNPSSNTPPPQPYGRQPLQPRLKDQAAKDNPAFLKVELDKPSAYKGEQVIVSYYFYHPMRIFNIQVDKFPVLNGFLREDLELPVMGQRLDSEQVFIKGVPYEKVLLAKYAAYPLQEGSLPIDTLSLKYNYYSGSRNGLDEEDPFFGFFQQLTPRVGQAQSEKVTLQVSPLPSQGRPASFVGGIGNFNLTSAVDKYEVHANEAVTLTVKVEGEGNVSSVQEPKVKWPDGIELYETQSRAVPQKGIAKEKIFEFLIIPRVPGKVTLPALEFGFFNPKDKAYYVKATDPIELNVLDPAPGTTLVQPSQSVARPAVESPKAQKTEPKIRPLRAPGELNNSAFLQPIWKGLYWVCLAILTFLLGLIAFDLLRKKEKKKVGPNQGFGNWSQLHEVARRAETDASWNELTEAYELLTENVLQSLENRFQIGVKSLSRGQLKEALVSEERLTDSLWERVVKLLEYSDLVRFASSVGAVSQQEVRQKLKDWVKEAESLVSAINRVDQKKAAGSMKTPELQI